LIARGHKIENMDDSYMDFGSAQFAWKTEHGYIAASDPRRDGQAVGY
jgi:gamma-glutamyltranspeptidase/glutathione hydrolase